MVQATYPLSFDPIFGNPDSEYHDPAGLDVQAHELPNGELLITFSDEWCARMDWKVGDEVIFEVTEEGLSIRKKD